MRFLSGIFLSCLLVGIPFCAFGQTRRIINQNQIDQSTRIPERRENTPLPRTGSRDGRFATPRGEGPLIRLHSLSLTGSSLPAASVETFWSRWRGREITANQTADIAADMKQFYSDNDYALYAVDVTGFENGRLALAIVEGSIGEIEFTGDADRDLSLVRAYAAKVIADKPLRRSTFQRYLLLMGDIPGLSVDPVFLPLRPEEGVIKLEIALTRKAVGSGLGYTNQGLPSISRAQFDARLAFNSVFRQGDVTELGYGFPDDFGRYRLLSFFHEQPVGDEGTRLSLFHNDFRSTPDALQEGTSRLTVVQLMHPLLRGRDGNVSVTVSLDHLDNENSILGQFAAYESTRIMRLGLSADTTGETGSFTGGFVSLSKGFDILKARRDIFFGNPDFLKATLQLRRDQKLPGGFSARLRGAAQYAPEALPSSEQIIFGGPDYGGAFEIARFAADRGAVAAGELVYSFGSGVPAIQQPELYGYADYGYLANVEDIFLPSIQRASSAGFGIRFGLFDRALLQFQAGHPLETPDNFDKGGNAWRYFVQLRTAF